MSDDDDQDDEIIIIRRAADSPKLTAAEQALLSETAEALEAGQTVTNDTEAHVRQLLGKAVFG